MEKFTHNNNEWEYVSAKSIDSRQITHKDIVGDVFRKTKERPISELEIVTGSGKVQSTPIYKYKEKLSFTEKVVGYIPMQNQEGTYVRIIKKSLAKILVPIIILFALIIGGLLIWNSLRGDKPNLDKSAIAYQMPNGAKNEDPTQIMMPFYDKIYIDKNGKCEIALLNPDGNSCYFEYVLTLTDTNEDVYKSGLIKPGMAVPEWTLNQKIKPGEYDANLKINTSQLSDHTQSANGGNMAVKVIVEE